MSDAVPLLVLSLAAARAGGGVVLVLAGLLAVLVVAVIRNPQQHVVRRLWPEVAAAGAAR